MTGERVFRLLPSEILCPIKKGERDGRERKGKKGKKEKRREKEERDVAILTCLQISSLRHSLKGGGRESKREKKGGRKKKKKEEEIRRDVTRR